MGDWRSSTWGNEITLEYGKGIRGYSDTPGPYRVFGSNGPVGWTYESIASGPGVILGRKGAYRGIRFSREPFFVIDTAYYVVPKTDLDMRWLYYAIIYHRLGEIDDGSPIPSTTRAAVYVRDVDVPPLDEQRAIASVLGALDDKIDLNRRMNETLEAMARAIFKDWFVDFGPTRAKIEGRAPYLAPEIWSLFPDRLDNEGKPQGWTILTLAELAAQSGGQIRTGPFGTQLHRADYRPTGRPVVMPANLISGEIVEDNIARIGPEMVARLSDHAMSEGDIVYGRRGDIGRKALVGPNEAGWLCGTGCLRISIRSNSCPPAYIFYYLDRPEIQEWISTRAVGATMPNLNTGILGEVQILVPTSEIASQFVLAVEPLIHHARTNRSESKTLAATRDLLLSKLMSGEIRVRDAENPMRNVA
jgi:type I restriction enzyme S subunit